MEGCGAPVISAPHLHISSTYGSFHITNSALAHLTVDVSSEKRALIKNDYMHTCAVFDSLSQAIVVPKGQYEAAMSQTLFTEALSSWKSGKRPSWYSCTFSAAFTSQSSEEPKAAQEVPEWAARCIHKNNVKEDTTMDWTPSW